MLAYPQGMQLRNGYVLGCVRDRREGEISFYCSVFYSSGGDTVYVLVTDIQEHKLLKVEMVKNNLYV